jgi:hypothetical protein
MARAQELQEWFWENWKMVMVVPHTFFVMAGLHIKRSMFYP